MKRLKSFLKGLAALTGACALLLVVGLWSSFSLFRAWRHLPPFTHGAASPTTTTVALRDGVALHTQLFLPEGPGPFPTVLVRNPYELLNTLELFHCGLLNRYGYACVLQDVRGRLDSPGEWNPLVHERDDTLDAVAWLIAQPFVDGNVAMMGPSYLAASQLAAADSMPPQVKTLIPAVFGTELYEAFYERGLLRHDVLTAWATLMPDKGMRRWASSDYLAAAARRPAIDADVRYMTRQLDWYRSVLDSSNPKGPFWSTPAMQRFREGPARTHLPVLLLGGFFEPFFLSQARTWASLSSQAQSVWLIGPWDHLGVPSGALAAPSGAEGSGLYPWPQLLEWLDHHLKGKPLRTLKPGTVRTLAFGSTEGWREHAAWPAPRSALELTLGAGEQAQSCAGGSLAEAAGPDSSATFVYDPAQPNPTRGGASLLSFAFYRWLGLTPGPAEQGNSCARDDVLTFRGAPLTTPLRLSGAPTLKLTVRSTAPDTAFVARLIQEHDGKAVLIREAAATLAWPTADAAAPQDYTPGSDATLQLDFWPLDWVAPAGARLRVDLSSSSFPALHAHNNRKGDWAREAGFDVATQTVVLGEGKSALRLPLE